MTIVATTDFTYPSLEIEERTLQTLSECWRHSTQLLNVFPWSADLPTIPPYLMAPNLAQVTFEIESIGSLTNPIISEGDLA
jgi:hypothetical protein